MLNVSFQIDVSPANVMTYPKEILAFVDIGFAAAWINAAGAVCSGVGKDSGNCDHCKGENCEEFHYSSCEFL